jgi:hypothetical protein
MVDPHPRGPLAIAGFGADAVPAGSRDLFEVITHPGFRVVVALIITFLGLPVCFYVVLSNSKFDDTARNFASGFIGGIVGFWLKP